MHNVKESQGRSGNVPLWIGWIVSFGLEPINGGANETTAVNHIQVIGAGLVDKFIEIAVEIPEPSLPSVEANVYPSATGEVHGT